MVSRNPLQVPANPGANSQVTVYDDEGNYSHTLGLGDPASSKSSVRVTASLDQTYTLRQWWAKSATGPLRLVETWDSITTTAVRAASAVTCVAKANLTNNDYITVTVGDSTGDSSSSVLFEYKVSAPFTPTAGRTVIDVSALTTDVEIAVATAAAIVAAFPGLVTAAEPTTATFTVKHVSSGSLFPCAVVEHVANAGYTVALTSAVEGTGRRFQIELSPGRNKVTLHTGTAPTEFDVAVEWTDAPSTL